MLNHHHLRRCLGYLGLAMVRRAINVLKRAWLMWHISELDLWLRACRADGLDDSLSLRGCRQELKVYEARLKALHLENDYSAMLPKQTCFSMVKEFVTTYAMYRRGPHKRSVALSTAWNVTWHRMPF